MSLISEQAFDQCVMNIYINPETGEEVVRSPEELEKRQGELDEFLSLYDGVPPLNKKKKKKILHMTVTQFDTYKIGIEIEYCCRVMNLERAYKAYLLSKEKDTLLSNDVFSNLVNLVSGLGKQGMGSGPKRIQTPPQDVEAASVVFTGRFKREDTYLYY